MAVLDTLPGLTVSIHVGGEPLPEYEDDTEEETPDDPVAQYQVVRTVCKYVEATSDKEFCIEMSLDPPYRMDCPALVFSCWIDGNLADEVVLHQAEFPKEIRRGRVISPVGTTLDGVGVEAPGVKNREFLKKFKFVKIETSTNDDKLENIKRDAKGIKEAGEIVVKVFRGAEPKKAKKPLITTPKGFEPKAVHEKALKGQATSHSTRLGPATELIETNYLEFDNLDGDDCPLAIFKFRYRSREALKSLLILKRTPSPDLEEASLVPAPINLENLNPTQKSKLERFLQDLVNGGGTASESPSRAIKREHDENGSGSGLRKKRKSGEKVTVDLTADTDDDEKVVPLN